jgi:redox-sensitive bicupin YhaK (pirin superfamily)
MREAAKDESPGAARASLRGSKECPMITLRRAHDRFHSQIGWLDSWHTFSFADHYDPDFLGFRQLRVINDDTVAAGEGFGAHPHRDMEILSYVLDGALEHKDSIGTGSIIRPGEVQRMSAGTGVVHSEFNASPKDPVHFLQIWIVPEKRGIAPGYEQKKLPDTRGVLRLVAAREPTGAAVKVHQDVAVYSALLDAGQEVRHELRQDRHAWVHVARGAVELNGQKLAAGDGAAITDEPLVSLRATGPSEVLLFDLA